MSVADTLGYPAAYHINVVTAQHQAQRGMIYPVSGDNTLKARSTRKHSSTITKRITERQQYSLES